MQILVYVVIHVHVCTMSMSDYQMQAIYILQYTFTYDNQLKHVHVKCPSWSSCIVLKILHVWLFYLVKLLQTQPF